MDLFKKSKESLEVSSFNLIIFLYFSLLFSKYISVSKIFLSTSSLFLIFKFFSLFLIKFEKFVFLIPLPFDKRDKASNILVFPHPLFPKKYLIYY